MKKKWLYFSGCIIAPHIMLGVGMFFLSKKDLEHRTVGFKLCQWSTIVLIVGSLTYYVFFTPITGLD